MDATHVFSAQRSWRMLAIGLVICVWTALVGLGQENQIASLIKKLGDDNAEIRLSAAWELGDRNAVEAVDPLLAALGDKEPQVRAWAAWALGKIKQRVAVAALASLLNDENPLVRKRAAEALGGIGDQRALDPLIAALINDTVLDFRRKAIEALRMISGRSSDSAVRTKVEEAIENARRSENQIGQPKATIATASQAEEVAQPKKNVSRINTEEVKSILDKRISNSEIPTGSESFSFVKSSWKLPEAKVFAEGVRAGDNEYFLVASAEASQLLNPAKGNLAQFIPEIGDAEQFFLLNGVLFSSVDFEVVNGAVLSGGGARATQGITKGEPLIFASDHSAFGGWTKASQRLTSGGYVWYLGEPGLYLKGLSPQQDRLICFERPLLDFLASIKTRMPIQFQFSLTADPNESSGFLFEIAGRAIELRLR